MKEYVSPEVKVVLVDVEDVITASDEEVEANPDFWS